MTIPLIPRPRPESLTFRDTSEIITTRYAVDELSRSARAKKAIRHVAGIMTEVQYRVMGGELAAGEVVLEGEAAAVALKALHKMSRGRLGHQERAVEAQAMLNPELFDEAEVPQPSVETVAKRRPEPVVYISRTDQTMGMPAVLASA